MQDEKFSEYRKAEELRRATAEKKRKLLQDAVLWLTAIAAIGTVLQFAGLLA